MSMATAETTSVMTTIFPLWGLSVPLPAIILISIGFYMGLLALVLWCHYCLKTHYKWTNCCPNLSPCEWCHKCAQSYDFQPPHLSMCPDHSCPSSNCAMWECTCPRQPRQGESINCIFCEIQFK